MRPRMFVNLYHESGGNWGNHVNTVQTGPNAMTLPMIIDQIQDDRTNPMFIRQRQAGICTTFSAKSRRTLLIKNDYISKIVELK